MCCDKNVYIKLKYTLRISHILVWWGQYIILYFVKWKPHCCSKTTNTTNKIDDKLLPGNHKSQHILFTIRRTHHLHPLCQSIHENKQLQFRIQQSKVRNTIINIEGNNRINNSRCSLCVYSVYLISQDRQEYYMTYSRSTLSILYTHF
jgi:hypothetical protein